MSGSLATCLVLCVVWLAADCGSADLPHNEAADGALNSASDGALNSAADGALNSASDGALNSAADGVLNSAAGGALDSAADGSVNSPSGGAMDSPSDGALNSAADGALDSAADGSVNSPSDGALNSASSGALNSAADGALKSASDGALNSAADGALNSASDGALNSADGGALNSASVGTSSAILVGRSVGSHIALSNTTATSVSLEETAFVYREDDTDVSEPAVIQDSHSGAETQGFYSNGWPTSASSFAGTTRGPKELQIRLLAPRLGHVYTPGFDEGERYPALMDSWVTLAPPPRHVTMLSIRFHNIEDDPFCWFDYLELYKGGKSRSDVAWRLCGRRAVRGQVYDSPVLYLFFHSDTSFSEGRGFKLVFSYHQRSVTLPQQLPSGQWNCSVPEWPEFQPHFACDLMSECVGGEDEVDCPYTGHCGQGKLSISDGCYEFVHSDKELTWTQASNICRERNGHLVALNTPDETREVLKVLDLMTSDSYFPVGLQSTVYEGLPDIYRKTWRWVDGTIAYYARIGASSITERTCGYFDWGVGRSAISLRDCQSLVTYYQDFLCEMSPASSAMVGPDPAANKDSVTLSTPSVPTLPFPSVRCPAGHLTHSFLACDAQSACWVNDVTGIDALGHRQSSCDAPLPALVPQFQCGRERGLVPYSLVCDWRQDCLDGTDEAGCYRPPCRGSTPLQCINGDCIRVDDWCDGKHTCRDGSDEGHMCKDSSQLGRNIILDFPPPPARIDFLDLGGKSPVSFSIQPLPAANGSKGPSHCPATHFQCPGGGFCLPVFLRCNGVNDCPGREDEADCDSYTCPGFFRCRGSTVCLHPDSTCDGWAQCPQFDDESFCGIPCPDSCTCLGLAFVCPRPFSGPAFPELRYVDAAGSGMTPRHFEQNVRLVHLGLARCRLQALGFLLFPNLDSLDLRHNRLRVFNHSHLVYVSSLRLLLLAGNPLSLLFAASTLTLPSLLFLDLSDVPLRDLDVGVLSVFPKLETLNLSASGLDRLTEDGFQSLTTLRILDVRGCPLSHFLPDVLQGLARLTLVFASNYKLCCAASLPAGFHLGNCRAPFNEVSSCEDLLRSNLYRAALAVFTTLALLSNVATFLLRVLVYRSSGRTGFGVFVTQLCVSDFVMGLYLAIVGVADIIYRGGYLWEDVAWRHSSSCRLAGFLSLLSSEVSAFIVCFITLDRFLTLRFPFSRLRFQRGSAYAVCAAAWIGGVVIAGIPLLPGLSHWSFYSQTGICIPLPITRNDFAGHQYAFGVIIVLNFFVFLLIAAGQASIFWSIRANRMASLDTSRKSQDLSIARRLFTIAMSNFLCWFPIGLLGLLASRGQAISGEVNVGMAIFVLPLNSALNPFLYNLNMILEKRRRAREERFVRTLMVQVDLDQ